MTWGIIPAAGAGSRMQPLAFSKELLPVGCRDEDGNERPRAVSEYLVERMIRAGARKICFVIAPGKSDILEYHGAGRGETNFAYVVQPRPAGLCDAIFRAIPLIGPDETVLIGLPDTIWFPEDALGMVPATGLSFLLFPVERPELFDAVVTDGDGRVLRILVKEAGAETSWIWGAVKAPARVLRELHELWRARGETDQYVGTLVNAWIEHGGEAHGIRAGGSYVDVGTPSGYRDAVRLLGSERPADSRLSLDSGEHPLRIDGANGDRPAEVRDD